MTAVQKKKKKNKIKKKGTNIIFGKAKTARNYSWPMSLLFTDGINRFCHDDALLSLQLVLIQINS